MSYRVVLQCLTQMLCPFSTNIVYAKMERGECLYRTIVVNMQWIRRQFVLRCCFAMLEPDVVPLHHRYYFPRDRACWVSISNDSGEYAVDKKTICPTVLFCNSWLRCCAPLAPILFTLRSSVVDIYIKT